MRTRLLLAAGLLASASAVWAQEAPPEPRPTGDAAAEPAAIAAELADETTLDAEELDTLVAPVALYPDALLTQVLVAATYPLDVVKADRWVSDNAGLDAEARADAAAEQPWDESVAVLAGGFPDVLHRMADDIDWTESLGDAMIAQTDDLLDAVQRMRARAAAAGNLDSNEAQTVETDDTGDISIAPAEPDVVYVPTYDPVNTFAPVPTAVDTGTTVGGVLATGAVAFGAALLVDEIFDDDDWDDDWHGGHIDWDDDAIYPGRGGINAGGDVNIDVDRERNRTVVRDRERIGEGGRIGDGPRPGGGAWTPTTAQRDAARDRVAERKAVSGPDAAARRQAIQGRAGAAGGNGAARASAEAKLKARTGQPGGLQASAGGRDAAAARTKAAERRPAAHQSALKPGAGGNRAHAATARGASSARHDVSPTAVKARANAHPRDISRSGGVKASRKPPGKSSAFKKPSGNHSHASAARRGGASHGRRR